MLLQDPSSFPSIITEILQNRLVFGTFCYITSLLALNAFENAKIIQKTTLTKKEQQIPWITPLTSNQAIPLPIYENLDNKFLIGSRIEERRISQFIKKPENEEYKKGICELSDTWSKFYDDKPIVIFKEIS